ncbi:MAG: hypothetical protein DLM58_04535 [Pseudonocardiales bacterium]|nr:MAG: hypothetical protein DLM58_04535 [Pseudonocardiales bacterium]
MAPLYASVMIWDPSRSAVVVNGAFRSSSIAVDPSTLSPPGTPWCPAGRVADDLVPAEDRSPVIGGWFR